MVEAPTPPEVVVRAHELDDLRALLATTAQESHRTATEAMKHSHLLDGVFSELKHLKDGQHDLIVQVHDISKRMVNVESGLNDLRTRFIDLRLDVSDMKAEMVTKSELAEVRAEVTELQAKVSGIETKVTGIQAEVAEIRTEVAGTHGKLDLLLVHFGLN
ncbi:hypothetical protein ACGFIV_10565 [Sphaerisporangium sp. NPDC049003]|uniref:hypothetical protein n=1 Tax=Sphaerisporangium sp. NPDC049003 TaxID=3364517 RepID=UPI003711DA4E